VEEIEDELEGFDVDILEGGLKLENPTDSSKGVLISSTVALALRKVVFPGTGTEDSRGRAYFNEEWKGKGFVFKSADEVAYGLVQIKVSLFCPLVLILFLFLKKKGGPCGLLAVVQSFILKHLIFGGESYADCVKLVYYFIYFFWYGKLITGNYFFFEVRVDFDRLRLIQNLR
jgi:ubiquitin carboxyl-terminal hydrolase MINDY-3/4